MSSPSSSSFIPPRTSDAKHPATSAVPQRLAHILAGGTDTEVSSAQELKPSAEPQQYVEPDPVPPARPRFTRPVMLIIGLLLLGGLLVTFWHSRQTMPLEETAGAELTVIPVSEQQPLLEDASAAREHDAVLGEESTIPSGVNVNDTADAAAAPDTTIFVHVMGPVKAPGVYELAAGARIADAVEAAGGLKKTVVTTLNLAAVLQDGTQINFQDDTILVGQSATQVDTAAPAATGPGLDAAGSPVIPDAAAAADQKLELNSATLEQLQMLPGVGPVLAERIATWRDTHGGFTDVQQLSEVSGIGPARLADLLPRVYVGAATGG